MVELQDLSGVGESREENLREEGYETPADLAEADPDELADSVNYLPDDTALELVVQAQNIVEEDEAEVTEETPSVTEEVEEALGAEEALEESPDGEDLVEEFAAEPAPDEEEEPAPDEEATDTIVFELTFDTALEYDTFFDSVMAQRVTMLRTNRDGISVFDSVLDQMRSGKGVDSVVELEMEEGELNNLHSCVRETMVGYKGNNLIDHMDALKSVLNDINDVRNEHLF